MRVVVLGDGLLGSEIVKQTGWDCLSRKKDKFDITHSENFNDYLLKITIVLHLLQNTIV